MSFPSRVISSGVLVAFALADACAAPPVPAATPPVDPFGSDRARAVVSKYPVRGKLFDSTIPPRSPAETVASFKLLPGFKADVVLAEPAITQPVFLNFDERGRMWVVQFIQYPYPAGLKIVDLGDQFHATYDKVPPAPPNHDRGADRISIHEDTDGDGTFDSHKVFLDGLNMVTAVERGRGGVWVLNPPYLLFYPDANNDDVPDGNPTVHLAGFGLEDTHSAANSLRWGPDGWLWGAQGSGVTAKVRRPGIDAEGDGIAFKGQAIWRYHPERKVFELFAEGGGNPFCVALDSQGRVFGGDNGSKVRGYHYVQGGFYKKSWGEHGYLTNPYAFGFFGAMLHNWDAPRFTHALLVYEESRLGDAIEGRVLAANAPLHRVELTERIPHGSTYRTRDVAAFLESDDQWFRPVDIKTGPDGAVYLADWYDTRLTHQDPRDNWDRERGRVYRIREAAAAAGVQKFDLSKSSSAELVKMLGHRQAWFRRTALRLLADRRDGSLIPRLLERARDPKHPYALDALWGLHAVGGFSAKNAEEFLRHPQAVVRMWTIRLLGDHEQPISPAVKDGLRRLAGSEPDAQVRSQLAASARRLPADVALPVIFALMRRTEDTDDPQNPLLVWWALERFAESHRAEIVSAFSDAAVWDSPLARTHVIHRLAQRYVSHPTTDNQQTLARLAKAAPESGRARLRQGITEAFAGRGLGELSPAIEAALFNPETRDFSDPVQLNLAIKRGDQSAVVAALGFIVREEPALEADRIRVIEALADSGAKGAASALLDVLSRSRTASVREAALSALGRFNDKQLVADVLRLWTDLDAGLRHRALLLFVSRQAWARDLIGKVGKAGIISKADIPDEIVQRVRLLGDEEINKLADRYFGVAKVTASAEKMRRMAEIQTKLAAGGPADSLAGRGIFEMRCAACHKLYGRGGEIGPDLTGYERANVPNLLLSMIDPSLSIREGFATFQINTRDDRTLVGFLEGRDPNRLMLRDTAGQRIPIAASDVREERVIPLSLMPEGLLEGLSDQELRDLFAYLTSATDPPATTK